SQNVIVVGLGVFSERLGDKDAGVVDQRIDPAELLDRAADHPFRDGRIGDVAGDGQYVRRSVGLDGPRVRNDAVATIDEPADQSCPDPLRRAGDDGDFACGTHDESPCSRWLGSLQVLWTYIYGEILDVQSRTLHTISEIPRAACPSTARTAPATPFPVRSAGKR